MTILTATNPTKHDAKDLPKKPDSLGQVAVPINLGPTVLKPVDTNFHLDTFRNYESNTYASLRRRKFLTTICGVLLVLWLLLAASIGGILLYRHYYRKPYSLWCGTDIGGEGKPQLLQQKVEIDQNFEYEKIDVPRFGANRPALFVHDFRQNLTAIVDIKDQQCFIKPLDRERLVPPKSFIDLVRKMEEGYYEQTSEVIQENYVARLPSLSGEELSDLGSWLIEQQCRLMTSYILEKIVDVTSTNDHFSDGTRRKRSAAEQYIQFTPSNGLTQYQITV